MNTYVPAVSALCSAYSLQPFSLALTLATSSLATFSNSASMPGLTFSVATTPSMLPSLGLDAAPTPSRPGPSGKRAPLVLHSRRVTERTADGTRSPAAPADDTGGQAVLGCAQG